MRWTFGIILLLVYVGILSTLSLAEYSYQTGKNDKDLRKLRLAAQLNPLESDYRYEIFQQSTPKDLDSIKEAIRLEPLKASYHMFYAIELLRDYNKRTRQSDQIAFHEIARAYQLKPYSAQYRKIYEQDSKPFLIN